MAPKISIIVPVYNKSEDLKRSIPALFSQSFDDFEVICVNDGSTDDSGKVLAELAKRDSRVKIIGQENKGTSVARKTGVLASSGEYVMFLDPDDGFVPDACEKALKAIQTANADILQFGTDIHFSEKFPESDKKPICDFFTPHPDTFEGMEAILNGYFPNAEYVRAYNLWMHIFSGDICRKAFAEVADKRILIGEDGYAFILCAYFSKRAASIPDELYIYNFGNGVSGINHKLSYIQRCCEDAESISFAQQKFSDQTSDQSHLIWKSAHILQEFLIIPFLYDMADFRGSDDEQNQSLNLIVQHIGLKRCIEILHKKIEQKQLQIEHLSREMETIQEKYQALQRSLSWRITAPLRTVKNF